MRAPAVARHWPPGRQSAAAGRCGIAASWAGQTASGQTASGQTGRAAMARPPTQPPRQMSRLISLLFTYQTIVQISTPELVLHCTIDLTIDHTIDLTIIFPRATCSQFAIHGKWTTGCER
eukprot:5834892-Pyramimonas_sp.AAC.2